MGERRNSNKKFGVMASSLRYDHLEMGKLFITDNRGAQNQG